MGIILPLQKIWLISSVMYYYLLLTADIKQRKQNTLNNELNPDNSL